MSDSTSPIRLPVKFGKEVNRRIKIGASVRRQEWQQLSQWENMAVAKARAVNEAILAQARAETSDALFEMQNADIFVQYGRLALE